MAKNMRGLVDKDPETTDVYAGANSNVAREAGKKHASRKTGGRAMKMNMKHLDMHGKKANHRLDRPARNSGGMVSGGAEMRPFSAANKVKSPAGRMVESGQS